VTARWLPDGFHTVTPNIVAEDAAQAVSFLKRAFGATENYRLTLADGSITHCELRIGDSIVNLGTAMKGPFGNVWIIATPKERLTPEEMQRRLRAEGY